MKTPRETAVTALVGVAVWLSMLADARAGEVLQAKAEPDKITAWEGFERRDFKVDGRNCLLVVPASPAKGKPWIWRTEFFGHQPQADVALMHKGFQVAYMDVQNLYGAPVALDHMDKFYKHLTTVRSLAPKTVLEGFSRGGLFALNWAARHPDRVACVYNDAPVCDFKSWPGGKGKSKGSPGDWQRCLKAYGLTEQQALDYKLNPVDNLEGLAKAKVPLLHVCGEADEVVPIDENTRLVEKRYQKLGGPITVIAKPGVSHHPHSLENPAPIVAFVLKHTIGGSAALLLPESPSDYRVFQRQSWDAGPIRLRGRLVAHNPNMDIVITYFVNPSMLKTIQEGKTPLTIASHEEVARHYHVSTVHLAQEVADRIRGGTLTWKQYGGVHPDRPGNELCASLIAQLWNTASQQPLPKDATPVPHRLPEQPLDAGHYGKGRFIDPKKALLGRGWTLVTPDWKKLPGSCRERFRALPLLCATEPGADLTLEFEGNAVGAYLLAGPDAGGVEVSINGSPFTKMELFHRFSQGLHYPRTVLFASDLQPGTHKLNLRIAKERPKGSSGTALRIIQFVAN